MVSKEWNNTSLHPWSALNVKDRATTERFGEDIRYMEGVAKMTQTIRRKIAQMELNAYTVKKTILLSQVTYTS